MQIYFLLTANKTLYLIKHNDANSLPDTWQGEAVTWSEVYYGYDGPHADICREAEHVIIDPSLADFYEWYNAIQLFNGLSKVKRFEGLQYININENTEYITAMFRGCSSLEELDLSHFNTVNVRGMGVMFQGCTTLTRINLSNVLIHF